MNRNLLGFFLVLNIFIYQDTLDNAVFLLKHIKIADIFFILVLLQVFIVLHFQICYGNILFKVFIRYYFSKCSFFIYF